MISNLFNNNKPYALIENVRTKYIIFGETLRIKGKQFKQNLHKNCSKSTKIAITACKFSKTFRVSMTSDPPKTFFIFKCLNMILPEKNTLENISKFGAPSLKKNSEYAADMKTFFKGLIFKLFLGLPSLYLVNIQTNQTFIPSTKNFWIRSCTRNT